MFCDEVCQKIKEENIKPKPKWQFLAKKYLVWASGILSLLIGSLSFAIIIFLVRNNDWDLINYLGMSKLKFALVSIPYFWIISSFIFLFLIYFNFKHTKDGYKYNCYKIFFGVIFLSVVFGSLFYNVGLGQALENKILEKVPVYAKFLNPQAKIWNQPEKGLLLGEIKEMQDEKFLEIKNYKGEIWKVEKKLLINDNFKMGDKIKMIGKQIREREFEPTELRLYNPPARGLMRKLWK